MSTSTPTDLSTRSACALIVSILITGLAGAACRSEPAAPVPAVTEDTYAVVNGRQITRADVEKAFRRARPSSEALSEEERLAATLGVIDEMIVEDLLLAKAQELKLEVPDSEVDEAFAATKQNIPENELQEELTRRKLTTDDVREGLRRELLARKVLEREVTEKITVTDAEVTAFFEANRAQFNLAEDAYRLAQIVVTPVQDAQPASAGDDATTPQEAQTKAAGLMRRLKEGVPFAQLARDHSEDPQTAARGGDLGLVPLSALQRTAPALRNAVLKSAPGAVTSVNLGGLQTIVLVLGLEKAGQRDLSMPAVRDNITANLRDRREQLLRAAYLTTLRTDADVVNYFARRLVESQAK